MHIYSYASISSEGAYVKEKKEIIALKKELNEFYNKKEKEYQENKAKIEKLLSKIKKEKDEIKTIYERNQEILKNIEGKVASKTAKIYNGMKPKIAGEIFTKMIKDGKIDDVFDIIITLKESKVTLLMKYLDKEDAADLTTMLKNYKVK
jgi:flagellar motility protein MotE (MotC chaperone)